MGALHEGHLSLVKQSINQCNHTVVSIFLNGKQFSPDEDFEKYPRTLSEDVIKLESLNVDVLFLPKNNEIYPENYSTYIEENNLSIGLESTSRPHFFKGVLTVVLKLFNIIQPDFSFFGKKDIQQLRLVEKMVQDLNLQIVIIAGETIREKGGLAMSSRNTYLQKPDGLGIIYETLKNAKNTIQGGERKSSTIYNQIHTSLKTVPNLRVDYIEISNAKTLKSVEKIEQNIIISLAVFVGEVRLIDNIEVLI